VSLLTVGYFLEDVAQEALLRALVSRVAMMAGLADSRTRHHVGAAAGGAGTMLHSLRLFLRDCRDGIVGPFDLLVVARDSNCRGYTQTRHHLEGILTRSGYAGAYALAIPDPHIERWYLLDPQALKVAVGSSVGPSVPPYHCKRAHYKRALMNAFRDAAPQLGGIEWADDVVQHIDLYRAGQSDPAFHHFLQDVRQGLAHLTTHPGGAL
jgi:hypothetical protein